MSKEFKPTEKMLELRADPGRVAGDVLLGQELALGRLSRGVSDEPGPPTHERDGRVPGALGVDQPHHRKEAPEVEARRGRVEADVDGPRRLAEMLGRSLGDVVEEAPFSQLVDERGRRMRRAHGRKGTPGRVRVKSAYQSIRSRSLVMWAS